VSARADAATETRLERAWWLRVVAVLLAPRAVFAALRDDSEEAARAREEPITAIAGLAGSAGVLSTPVARQLLDDTSIGTIVVPVWAFIGGAVYGLALYWLLGLFLYVAVRQFGSLGSYRRARHVLAYAAVPLALSLLAVWPVRVAVYGSDLFRSGGSDRGPGDTAFDALIFAFAAWSFALLVIGVRAVHGWSWPRALAATAAAAALPVLVLLASLL
jgi:hypothetical protein